MRRRYATAPVEFHWKIALLDENRMSKSQDQCDWFYRRSGTIVRSPFMLHSGWLTHSNEYLPPNCMAEAAKDLGVTDDRVRLAIMEAGMRQGLHVGEWDVAATVAAKAAKLNQAKLLKLAKSAAVEKRVRATTVEFHSLQIKLVPAFLLENDIGDRAVFSGLVKLAPLADTIDAMLEDSAAYASYAAHHGGPPQT